MSVLAGLVAAIGVVLAVEVAVVMTTGATTHLLPGGFTLFAMLGAVALVRVAKVVGSMGVQEAAREPDSDDAGLRR